MTSAPDRKLCVVCSKVFRLDITTCPDDGSILVLEASGSEARGGRLGHVIGNYRLLRVLGEGGVGTVYEAEHIRLGRKMALKLLHADVVTNEVVTRFFNEARAVNEIRHPNIIEVEDFATTATGEHYMLMELLQGEDLRTVISRDGVVDPDRVWAIGEQIGSALASVHKQGIVHRDLKPDNIFLCQKDGREIAKLLDFGIAKFSSDTQGLTRAGFTMGTPEYMAPEQILSDGTPGPRGDIYSLGMVMYEALAGAPAFTATTTAAILRSHCYDPVTPPSDRRGEPLPPVLEAAVMKCLEKSQDNRFARAEDLVEALRADTPVAYTPPPEEAPAPVKRPELRKARTSPRRALVMMPAFLMAAAALLLHLTPRTRTDQANAAPAPAPVAAVPAPAPAPKPAEPSPPPAPAEITLDVSSDPASAEIFVGADRQRLGLAPLAAKLPLGTEPVAVVVRFPDGTEITESIVPDRSRPIAFTQPKAPAPPPVAAKQPVRRPLPAAKKTSQPTGDRDATLDPFK